MKYDRVETACTQITRRYTRGMTQTRRGVELKAFLRAMRSRLKPADVGLPALERGRRTAGLRSEEVASLAGVTLTWYNAFERGKDIRVSSGVLERVADVLRFSADERVYLAALATPVRGAAPIADEHVLLQVIVQGFTSGPAFVSYMFWNIGVHNALADAVYGFSSTDEKNWLARMLLEPEMRALHVDWGTRRAADDRDRLYGIRG